MSTIPKPGVLYTVFSKEQNLPVGFCAHGGYYRAEVNPELKPVMHNNAHLNVIGNRVNSQLKNTI